ncbi:HRDC domain-containing protein [Candidatus Magnetomorum sp. HK-1]|nr:HRDC domain-containing protein [Candidatus Magnetomorum sp. HK-1]
MSIQFKLFYLPAKMYSDDIETDLNQFLSSTRVNNIQKQFVPNGDNSFWSFLVEYIGNENSTGYIKSGKKKIDYREVLSPIDFALFAKLREWRKQEAAKDNIPVYTIFTNEQISLISTKRITTKKGLHELDGVGDARVKKYADDVIKIVLKHMELEKQSQQKESE